MIRRAAVDERLAPSALAHVEQFAVAGVGDGQSAAAGRRRRVLSLLARPRPELQQREGDALSRRHVHGPRTSGEGGRGGGGGPQCQVPARSPQQRVVVTAAVGAVRY